ncbi:MAG: hypothetical protein JWO77_1057 [Ilumatobacteraceae bacterium]|nr:hypothetical protein [Ilumatobacteraceae bacterium]
MGVYDADGTIRGELAYFVGARLGRRHCALCDITHGAVSERAAWRTCRAALPVPFETFHRNDQPAPVRALLNGRYPAVAAETDDGWALLLGPEELDACGSSPDALTASVEAASERLGLRWPS